jgi:NO-binding membrane sensor protein with MHYT domain
MAAPILLTPSYEWLFIVGAVFTCLVGSHSALLLASASLRLRLRRLTVLTALLFSVQCIFSLHFVAMSGMTFPVPWSFDIGLTFVSLALVSIFSTAAITGAMFLRQKMEPQVREAFPDYDERPFFGLYFEMFVFLIPRLPLFRLLVLVVLMVVGAAGCHHVGMWAMRGENGAAFLCELNYWSFLLTVGIGGIVCVVTVLAFILCPEGTPGMAMGVVLTTGVSVFHYSSAQYGMNYVQGETSFFNTGPTMGMEAIIVLVVLQGALSQIVTIVFSRIALANFRDAEQQLQVAQALGRHIARMDLDKAKEMHFETHKPSMLEQTLFQIVSNLELYRPYLPDTLFAKESSSEEGVVSKGCDVTCGDPGDALPGSPSHSTAPRQGRAATDLDSEFECEVTPGGSEPKSPQSPSTLGNTRHQRQVGFTSKNLALGLRPARAVILRVRLHGMDFGSSKTLNCDFIEECVKAFMSLVTGEIKAHSGTIVSCAGGTALAMWATSAPDTAVDCAIAIQRKSGLPMTQVVQCGMFLLGNLAAHQFRAFNLLGPTDWTGHLLLRASPGQRHILITAREWEFLKYKYHCLPYERVTMDGAPTNVYSVSPMLQAANDAEWMYDIATHNEGLPMDDIVECWQQYCCGQYVTARSLLAKLSHLPPWFPLHLLTLISQAEKYKILDPTKNTEAFGWALREPTGAMILEHETYRCMSV